MRRKRQNELAHSWVAVPAASANRLMIVGAVFLAIMIYFHAR
jgi:hypothetical protein